MEMKLLISHTVYPALNSNQIKHYISSTIKCIREIIHFQILDLKKCLCSADLNVGTINGMTHKMVLVSCQVLASILLVMHSAALTILSCDSLTLCTFS
jgi:hypothetical protein